MVPSPSSSGYLLKTKNADAVNTPAKAVNVTEFKATYPLRKAYARIVDETTKKGYRSDLRAEAVARASAVALSQRVKKAGKERKLRGRQAEKAKKSQDEI